MNEVMGRAVAALVDNLRAVGVPAEGPLAQLPVTEAELRQPACRIDWDDFVNFVEAGESAMGGPEALAGAFTRAQPRLFSGVLPLFRFMVSARELYRLAHKFLRMAYPHLTILESDSDEGRLTVTIEIPQPHRPCQAFLNCCAGGMRSVPEILGLPHVDVDAQLAPRRGVFIITLGESQTVAARLRRGSVSLLAKATMAEVEASWTETRRRLAELEEKNQVLAAAALRLEAEVTAHRKAEVALRAALDAFASSVFGVAPNGTVTALDATARSELEAEGSALVSRILGAARDGDGDATLCVRQVGDGASDGQIVLRGEWVAPSPPGWRARRPPGNSPIARSMSQPRWCGG